MPLFGTTGSAAAVDASAVHVLRLTGEPACHINHGDFWPTGVNLGSFFWDAWVAPGANTANYLISDGNGGGHGLLWGFQAVGDEQGMTGNVWPGEVPVTTFGTDDTIAVGEWAHVAVGWDGTTIYCFIDGILCGTTPYSSVRQAQYGQLYVGGSDHQNFIGDIAQLRGWEGAMPFVPGRGPYYGFTPERYFSAVSDSGASGVPASFVANYMVPGQVVVPDLSDGYNGRRHPGPLNSGPNRAGIIAISDGGLDSVPQVPGRPQWVASSTAPFDAEAARWSTGTIPAIPALPAGAKVFDSFNRAKQSLVLLDPTLGSTDARASLGAKVWQTSDQSASVAPYAESQWGIINGRAVSLMGGAARHAAWVASDSPDADVRVKRRSSAAYNTHHTGLSLRVQDGANLFAVYSTGPKTGATIWVDRNVAGSITNIGSWSAPATSWTTLRATFVGTTLTVYVDDGGAGWTQVGQLTGQTAFQAATGFGLANYGILNNARYDDFTLT